MRVQLGQCVTTSGVSEWMSEVEHRRAAVMEALSRHAQGDWGECCAEDTESNNSAAVQGDRLLSVYTVDGERLWIITEWDRSVTTILFPDEY